MGQIYFMETRLENCFTFGCNNWISEFEIGIICSENKMCMTADIDIWNDLNFSEWPRVSWPKLGMQKKSSAKKSTNL